MSGGSSGCSKEWVVPAKGEFRFEVDFGKSLTLRLSSGTAEIFGAELAPGREYTFSGQKLAVFSYDGAVLSVVRGECAVEYVVTDNVSVPAYLQLHSELERERGGRTSEKGSGPRVLILGSGRNTLARTLTNYAVRIGGRPLWVSTDVRTNPLFFPGSLSAHSLGAPAEAEDVSMVGGMASEGASPLTLFFGSLAISDNQKLWGKLVERLAFLVDSRLQSIQENGTTGCLIVGPGEQDLAVGGEEGVVDEVQRAFRADWIVVVGNDRLHARLQRHFARTPGIRVVKLPKSGGVVNWPRPGDWDKRSVHRLYQAYFYGPRQELNPFTQTLPFTDFSLYRVLLGDEDIAPASALPLGATRKLDECRAVRINEPTSSLLLYSLLAILHTPTRGSTPEPIPQKSSTELPKERDHLTDTLINGNVAGYLYVTSVDESRKTITTLSPCPGDPPSRMLLVGRLKWIE